MFRLRILTLILILTLAFLQNQSKAVNWENGNYSIPNSEWPGGSEVLNTYNDVIVTMLSGGGVEVFNMYDNSELTMNDGFINTLNLYPDATASLFGGTIHYLWVDPSSTGWVKLYADNVTFMPPNPSGNIEVHGWWLANPDIFFAIELQGASSYSHVQIVPEPATIAFFALGGLSAFRRRRQ
jgi:hypothetical protein